MLIFFFFGCFKEAKLIDTQLENGTLDTNYLNAPFLGVPFTNKELIGVKGLNFSAGQVLRKNKKAKDDAQVVKLMRKAGAIPLGVTITSELGFWFESSNHVYGQSKNPYDPRRIVGGSSGGEGAIISACGSPIGIGSDISGSIRMPAFFNGIFGHKPTNGLISNVGTYPPLTEQQEFMCTNGPLAKYADDLDLMLDVLAGDDKSKLVDYDNVRKPQIYY